MFFAFLFFRDEFPAKNCSRDGVLSATRDCFYRNVGRNDHFSPNFCTNSEKFARVQRSDDKNCRCFFWVRVFARACAGAINDCIHYLLVGTDRSCIFFANDHSTPSPSALFATPDLDFKLSDFKYTLRNWASPRSCADE